MPIKLYFLILSLVFLLPACAPVASRSIYLHDPHPAATKAEGSRRVSVGRLSRTDVRSALAVIKKVMLANGFHRVKPILDVGLIVAYRADHKVDGSALCCFVYREKHALEIRFDEHTKFISSHQVKRAHREVFEELNRTFGRERVTFQ